MGSSRSQNAKMSVTIRSDGAGRIDIGAARDVFLQDVVLDRAGEPPQIRALLLRDGDIERQQNDRRRVDGHRRRDACSSGDAVEQRRHVFDRVDRDADAADFARRERVVGVVAHLRGQVERDAQPADALGEQIPVAAIGFLGGGEAGVLPHRPQPAAVHRRLDATGEGELAREAQSGGPVPIGEIGGGTDVRIGQFVIDCTASSSSSSP